MYVQCTIMHEGKVPRWLEIHVLVISEQFCWKSSIHPTDLKQLFRELKKIYNMNQ